MNDKTTPSSTPPENTKATSGLNRRSLVRAGLSAAPVIAALHSGTVLAGGGDHSCIRPSSFSSLKAAFARGNRLSRGREMRDDFECKSHGYWKNHNGNLTSGFKNRSFLSSAQSPTGFTANPGEAFTGKSLQQVLDMNGNAHNKALARHVVAAYLSAMSAGNDPDRVLLTVGQCAAIWNGQGNWIPFAGASWTLTDTMAYFEKVFG